jgi:O-antigen/teichoic acid export membrane protein
MSTHDPVEALETTSRETANDVVVAVKNALTLGASLLLTWSLALVFRVLVPRYLGPERFGVFNFADGFVTSFFVLLSLGVDVYIQKEIPVRPAHATDFFGGFVVVRLVLSVLLFAAMGLVMTVTGRPSAVQEVVFIMGAAQLIGVISNNLASLLHASRTVDELAVLNVVTKVLWVAGAGLALALGFELRGLAIATVAVEAVRALALFSLARRRLNLKLTWQLGAVKAVIVASLPFYVGQVAHTAYSKIDSTVLSLLASDTEVGWFGAAVNLAGLSLLVSPLVSWVLSPLMSRAAARSEHDMFVILRQSLRAILMLVIPLALLLGLGADVWARLVFGEAFAPAALCLRIMAPSFVFTYVAMTAAMSLTLQNRSWTLTLISLGGLVIDPIFDVLFVPRGARWLGPSGAAAGAAAALVLAELLVAVTLVLALGKRAFDRPTAASLGKAIFACAVVIGADLLIVGRGPLRLAIDLGLYVVLVFSLGAVRPHELVRLVESLARRRAAPRC